MTRHSDPAPPRPVLACACANLRRAARAVTQLYDEALRDAGLRATQFALLETLRRKGELTQGQLGYLQAMDSTTLTRTLGGMRARGWIRSRHGDDRRERLWSLTSMGRRKAEQARPAWELVQKRVQSRFGRKRLVSMFDDLTAIVAAAS